MSTSHPRHQSPRDDGMMDDLWKAHYRYLLNVGYRMLGSISEAEDVVQEAFIRLTKVGPETIADVRGWLVVAVTRLCLDQLRSARSRREVYVGPWLPEPVVGISDRGDPANQIALDESVRMAMLRVLERLSPAERVAFVLHDVFQFSFDDIAGITGRSSDASRQLASRARKHVHDEITPARFTVDTAELTRIADRFIEAAEHGDLDALLDVLDPNVAGHADSGGLVPASPRLVVGREQVAHRFLGFLRGFDARVESARVNGEPGALVFHGEQLLGVITFDIRDGVIVQIHAIANPDKLRGVATALQVNLWADDVSIAGRSVRHGMDGRS